MTDTIVRPATDFVSTVAKMGHPEIMDIASERLRKLVAMTYITEFTADGSTKFETVRDDILGIMTENVGDIQKQIQAAREAKQTSIASSLYATLKPMVMDTALKVDSADRPLTFTIVFDYSAALKDPKDGSPIYEKDADGNDVVKRGPDFDLKVHWTAETKKASSGGTRTGNYQGRVAGDYTFPDSKADDGSLIRWGSMKKYALTVGYKDGSSELPRVFLEKKYDIPNQPVEVMVGNEKKPTFVATLKA